MSGVQVMPPLAAAEYDALRESIREQGVLVPVVFDGDGNLLDGNHRLAICAELGITTYPSEIVPGLDGDASKRTLARELNCERRHITTKQRRVLIGDQLRDTPSWADNRIAAVLGVDGKTVAAVRSGLESTSEIPKLEAHEGADGRLRAKRPLVLAKNTRELKAVFAALPDAEEELRATVTDARGVVKKARRARWHREAAAAGDAAVGSATLLLGDMRLRGAEIADDSVDLIFTDPPYTNEGRPLWAELSAFGARVLKPQGLLVAYSGCACFPWAFDGLRQHLEYWALGTLLHPGQHSSLFSRKVYVAGKFLIFMVRHGYAAEKWIDNLAVSPQPEKESHPWQQAIKPALDYIRILTAPGDLVVDPFLGGGTFGVAAIELGRDFVGMEVDAGAFATAEKRIRQAEEESPGGGRGESHPAENEDATE